MTAALSRPGLPVTTDRVKVTVRSGWLRRKPKVILDEASTHIAPGQFVGVLGASGSGKSTFIKTLAGLMPMSDGRVLVDGRPMTSAELKQDRRIAYLPQDVVIHEALTPRRALRYLARLKGLSPVGGGIRQAVARVAERTGITDRMDVPIRRLSGGQRKRVALAGELLGDPRVILLDEATSGLDPASEGEMMHLFRSLADEGKTVVCITHFPDRLALCDKLIYLMQGRVVFAGPPDELCDFFGTRTIEEVYLAQTKREPSDWREAFDRTDAGRHNALVQRSALTLPPRTGSKKPATSGSISQAITLLRRYTRLQFADWQNLLLLLLQAPVIGLMIVLTYGLIRTDFAEVHAVDTKEVLFLLVLAMLWCSGMASVREIVKESTIFQHETRFGLRLVPYLGSKLAFLLLLAFSQALILVAVVREGTELTGHFAPQLATIGLTAAVGLALGLLVSVAAGSSERAMTVLPVLLIMQAIFSGGMARLDGTVRLFSWVFVPAWWSLDGLRATLSPTLTMATYPNAPGHFQPPILGTGGPLALDLAVLTLHGLAYLAIAYLLLRRRA
ncbi:MAG: ATP-binding cassette domain-containing protein [Planctomycetota bacterium]